MPTTPDGFSLEGKNFETIQLVRKGLAVALGIAEKRKRGEEVTQKDLLVADYMERQIWMCPDLTEDEATHWCAEIELAADLGTKPIRPTLTATV